MRKIIALLCSLALFASISVACGSNQTGESSSVNSASSVASSEEVSFDTESEASSSEDEKGSGKEETSDKDKETEQYYTVTFDSDGGTFVVEQRVLKGEKVIKPENPTKESTETIDYEFIGWYIDGAEWNFDENTVEKDIILHAKWNEKKYSADLPI